MLNIRRIRDDEISWVNSKYDEVGFVHSDLGHEFIGVAEYDGKKAGLGRLVFVGEALELGGMYVFEEFRGKGVADAIVAFLIKNAPAGKTLYCLPFAHLKNFYTKFGFRPLVDDEKSRVPCEILKKHGWCNEQYSHGTLLFVLDQPNHLLPGPPCEQTAEI